MTSAMLARGMKRYGSLPEYNYEREIQSTEEIRRIYRRPKRSPRT